jgi:hypothetical protein
MSDCTEPDRAKAGDGRAGEGQGIPKVGAA